MIIDFFRARATVLDSPPTYLEAVTPSDSTDLTRVSRALNVEVGGTIQVTTLEGQTGTIYAPSNGVFPIRVTRVWASGTTAIGIVALS